MIDFRFSLATDIFPCCTIKCISWNSCTKYWVNHCLSFNQPLPNTHNHMQYDENFSCFQQIFVNKNILFFVIVQKFKSSECFLSFMFCVFVYKSRYVCLKRYTRNRKVYLVSPFDHSCHVYKYRHASLVRWQECCRFSILMLHLKWNLNWKCTKCQWLKKSRSVIGVHYDCIRDIISTLQRNELFHQIVPLNMKMSF